MPPCNIQTLEVLQWGSCLIAWLSEFPVDQAQAAWEAHRHHVLEAWEPYWKPHDILPACWAQLKFDGAAQIDAAVLDTWARVRIAGVG